MEADPDLVLRAVALVKRVRDGAERRDVLSGVSLEARAGEVHAITGPSGSGKTTLLGVLGGMLLPTSGEVFLDGEAVSRLRDVHRAEIRRKKVGYLFQDFALVSGMSVLENVVLPLVPDGIAAREAERLGLASLARFGVADRAKDRVDGLSGGEKQRVALARALVSSPRLVLLDEPTAHLDAARAASLLDDLFGIASRGSAVVVSSHDPRVTGDSRVHAIHALDGGVLR